MKKNKRIKSVVQKTSSPKSKAEKLFGKNRVGDKRAGGSIGGGCGFGV